MVNQYVGSWVEAMMSISREDRRPVAREDLLARLEADFAKAKAEILELYEQYVIQEAA